MLLLPPELRVWDERPADAIGVEELIAMAQMRPHENMEFYLATSRTICEAQLPNGKMLSMEMAFWKTSFLELQWMCAEVQMDVYGLVNAWYTGTAPRAPVIIDIGANIGFWSVLLARLFPEALVFSVEANALAVELLRMNIIHAGLSGRVLPLHLSISNTTGEWEHVASCPRMAQYRHRDRLAASVRRLYKEGGQDTCWTTQSRVRRRPGKFTTPVRTIRLEDLVGVIGLGRVDILKIDCEGCETRAGNLLRFAKQVVGEDHGSGVVS